ncbi:N-acetylmuramoyl-L-alanine amidase [Geomicrobium sp. JCM 19055]|uniref:N-acetylmuramoyl-L-alanine amidase n=1 Tax=Geomicrobium sp. JCM 19055 TaxID=1460649 RepID=UPI00045ED124|nr:N-acetylmuramoyl-L-alanine amidase [Geomicrobium sp. JCM 19055]GAJ98368.1 N-acetylmuramoyl-L-alanine amidase [Geomicrobium sp. JCM 19055]
MPKIFIDPGHGGHDPGAQGNGLREKDLVLQIGLKVRDLLRQDYENVQVSMSRTNDTFIALNERARLAVAWGADGFVSIHLNAHNGSSNGTETFMHSSSNLPGLRNHLQQNILREIRTFGSVTDRGLKSANFAVLRGTYQHMRTALTESLFVDSQRDAALLKRPEVIDAIARGHVLGIAAEFQLVKRSNPNGNPIEEGLMIVRAEDFQWASGKERFETVLRRFGNQREQEAYQNNTLNVSDAMGVLAKAILAQPSQTIPETHRDAWEELTNRGIFNGQNPNHPLTRAQQATVIKRLEEE